MAEITRTRHHTTKTFRNIVVDIADMQISDNPQDVLVTYALGSCLGVVLYDPVVRIGGLVHLMLPDSSIESNIDRFNPAKFVNTGVPALFKKMYNYGAKKERIWNAVVGGAQIMDDNGFFNIGKRNYAALRKLYWRNNVLIDKEHVGDRINRTIRLEIRTGNVYVKLSSGETILL